jgi:hypothetical protein
MDWIEFVNDKMGFKIQPAIAAFFGGLVAMLFRPPEFRKMPFWHLSLYVAAGVACAGYLAEPILLFTNIPLEYSASSGFVIGLIGANIIDKFLDFVIENDFKSLVELLKPNFFKNKDQK